MEWYVCVYFFFSFAEIGWATGRPNRKRWTTNYLNRRSVTVSRPSCRRGPRVSQRHHVDAAMGRHWSVSAGGWDPSGLMRTTVALSDHLLQPLGLPPPPNDAHVSINANLFTSQREKYVVDIKKLCFLFCAKQDPNSMKSASQAAKFTFFFLFTALVGFYLFLTRNSSHVFCSAFWLVQINSFRKVPGSNECSKFMFKMRCVLAGLCSRFR